MYRKLYKREKTLYAFFLPTLTRRPWKSWNLYLKQISKRDQKVEDSQTYKELLFLPFVNEHAIISYFKARKRQGCASKKAKENS